MASAVGRVGSAMMQCPSCNAAVQEGAKFCGKCGTALPRGCPACGHVNPSEHRFCSECGASLSPSSARAASFPFPPTVDVAPGATRKPRVAERRQITVLFCDMVGSTTLSGTLDPEEHREILSAFQGCCSQEIARFGGHVAQYMGDGVLVYFGYPAAHEDDAERAVRAGLAIIAAVPLLRTLPSLTLQVRVGIASGHAVVGDLTGAAQEQAAVGETTNLAARLQALAEPNTVLIAAETFRLVAGHFDYRDLGPQTLKGFGRPVDVRRVLGPSRAASRFEARREQGVAPLLGREEELDLLLRRWAQAKAGEGRVIHITGEPGIG